MSRYDELIAAMPRGSFYTTTGHVLPYRDSPYEFLFTNGPATTTFGVFVNDVFTGEVITDVNGTAIVAVQLGIGRADIRLENDTTGATTLLAFVTVRNWATWHAAYAETFDGLDTKIDDLEAAPRLSQVGSTYIEDVHGKLVRQPNDVGTYVHETYRQMLRQLRQGYRLYGARDAGLNQIVEAFTSTQPLKVPQSWRPHWWLGSQYAENYDLQNHARVLASDLTNINARSRNYARMSFASNDAVPTAQPTTPAILRITFAGGWPVTADLEITGVRPNGTIETEFFPATPGGTAPGTDPFRYILRVESTSPSLASSATLQTLDGLQTLMTLNSGHALPFAQPPVAQQLTVTFGGGWGAGDVVVSGLRPGGASVTETFPASPGNTVTGFEYFETIRSIAPTLLVAGSTATVGVNESRFVTVTDVGDHNGTSGTLAYTAGTTSFVWNGGNVVIANADGSYLLHGPDYAALLHSIVIAPVGAYTTFSLLPRLYLEADSRGVLPIILAPGDTAALVVTKINTQFAADVARYGPSYATIASLITGAGYTEDIIRLTSPVIGTTSSIKIHTGGYGVEREVFGFPRISTLLSGAHLAGSTTLTVDDASLLPNVTNDEPYQLRLGRNERDSALGNGTITPLASPTLATFSAPGLVPNDADIGGCVQITTGITNTGNHRVINHSGGNLIIVHEDANVGQSFTATAVASWSLEAAGELVTVIDNDGVTVLTLESATQFDHVDDSLVEIKGEMPIRIEGGLGLDTLTIDIDTDLAPSVNATDAALVIAGTDVPDHWLADNITSATMFAPSFFGVSNKRLRLVADGTADLTFTQEIPRIADDAKGFQIRCVFWVQHSIDASEDFTVDVSFDGALYTAGPIVSVPGTVSLTGRGTLLPTRVEAIVEVPYDATTFFVRLTHVGSGAGDTIYIERCLVTLEHKASVFLGSATIPRNDHRTYFGELLYVWSPNELNTAERRALAVPVLNAGAAFVEEPGHIDWVTNAHGDWDRVDVSEYDVGGTATNLYGTYNELEWLACTLTNLEVIISTPARLSGVRPTDVSARIGVALAPSGGGVATLIEPSNQLGAFPQSPDGSARLYENGVPLPDSPETSGGPDPWQWTDADEITIDPAYFTPGNTYVLDYQALIRAETPVIDLGSSFADYIWLLDAAIYRRSDVAIVGSTQFVQAEFGADLRATLAIRSDQDKSTSMLTRDTGSARIIIASDQWRYINATTIQVNGTAFDADSIYTIEYAGLTPAFDRPASFIIEARSAATAGTVSAATYEQLTQNSVVNRNFQYHQLRITINDVVDLTDIVVAGLGLKGIHFYGASPYAPGILV